MAADVAIDASSSCSCCAKLNKKYLKVKNERNVLNQGLKIYEVNTDKLVDENLQLKKAYAEEQQLVKLEKEGKVKESSIRQKLEKEILDLKAEISSCKKNERFVNTNDEENRLLKAHNLETLNEIKRLTELLDKEKKKADNEMKKAESEKKKAAEAWKQAESEKKKAAEAWKQVKTERNKTEELRKLAEIERKKAEDYSVCLEKIKCEAKEVREKLIAELSKAESTRKRVEAEKQKTNAEKTRADSLVTKLTEQKRLMEVENKKARDEKARADQLSQLLEEEKQRLEKKLVENILTPQGRCGSCNGEQRHTDVSLLRANLKLVKKQLKLEKKQAKYAKRMAKLEKAEKSCFIMQELQILKNNFMQTFSQLKNLDDHLSHNIEGTDAVKKIGKSLEIRGYKFESDLLGSKSGKHHPKDVLALTETCHPGSFDFTELTREHVVPRGSCTRPTTGIISELESLIGGSDRNKSQSSAICSNTSYSDKRSMGSQERGSFAVTASAKSTKKHPSKRPTLMKLPNDVARTKKSKEQDVMANNVDKLCGPRVKNACLATSIHDVVVEGETNRSSKRRKVQDSEKPVAKVYVEKNQSPLAVGEKSSSLGEKLCTFKDTLNIEGGTSGQNCPQSFGISHIFHNRTAYDSEDHNESCRQNCEHSSITMASKQQTPILCLSWENDNQKLHNKFDSSRIWDPNFLAETIPSSHQVRGNICIEQEGSAISKERADLISFENMLDGNYLKLLDLENDSDEERYRMAVKMPLSPTLPYFEFPNHQLCSEHSAHCVMERENLAPSHTLDAMATEIRTPLSACRLHSHAGQNSLLPLKDPGKTCLMELQDCSSEDVRQDDINNNTVFFGDHGCLEVEAGAPKGTNNSSSESQVLSSETRELAEGGKNILDAEIAMKGSTRQLSEVPKQTACIVEDSPKVLSDPEVGITPVYSVVFSNISDKESISRIFYVRSTLSCQGFLTSQIDHVVAQVHKAIAVNTGLLPEERSCVLFSLLLCNISCRMSSDFQCTMTELFSLSKSFAAEISKVLADAKTKLLFEEICQLDILAGLIEDFLIERKVLMCSNADGCTDTSSNLVQLDGVNVSFRAATINQFVAGCIILASISASAGRLGFLLENSYRILRMCKNDMSWVLLALHIFATVCGKEFFNISEHSFLIITLRSVVLLLERGHQSVSSISLCSHSVFEMESRFPPCKECPFSIGAVCMDMLTNLLLDVLHCYILNGVGNPVASSPVNLLVSMVPACAETTDESRVSKANESRGSKSKFDGQIAACHSSCCSFSFQKCAANFPDGFPVMAFCHFSDIVSLVELVGCYMTWEWTYDKIISRLLKMLEFCTIEEYSAALFVLIGQLGRFGINNVGSHSKRITELRCSIVLYIDTNIPSKMSFPTQLAVIGALLNLLPSSFRDIVSEDEELALDTSQSGHAILIKKWFSNLSKQQQSVSLNLFGHRATCYEK